MATLRADTVVHLCPKVVFKVLDDEAVLLDLQSGEYFGLNEIGCRIWQLIPASGRLEAIRDRLVEEYDVPADRAWHDLKALIAELLQRGLVSAIPAPPDPVIE
jgi:coenzyme PQQ synthesis protein D (PqqD)